MNSIAISKICYHFCQWRTLYKHYFAFDNNASIATISPNGDVGTYQRYERILTGLLTTYIIPVSDRFMFAPNNFVRIASCQFAIAVLPQNDYLRSLAKWSQNESTLLNKTAASYSGSPKLSSAQLLNLHRIDIRMIVPYWPILPARLCDETESPKRCHKQSAENPYPAITPATDDTPSIRAKV
jgi:hypothetical protein